MVANQPYKIDTKNKKTKFAILSFIILELQRMSSSRFDGGDFSIPIFVPFKFSFTFRQTILVLMAEGNDLKKGIEQASSDSTEDRRQWSHVM